MRNRCLVAVPLWLFVLSVLGQPAYSAEKVEQEKKSGSEPQQFKYDREEFAQQWKEVSERYPLIARAYLHLEAAVYQNVISTLPAGVVFQLPQSTDTDTGGDLSYSPAVCNLPPGVAISDASLVLICKTQCEQLASKHCGSVFACYPLQGDLRTQCIAQVERCRAGFQPCFDGCDEMPGGGCPW